MYALEIGNEVNLYPGGPRPKNYSLEDYVSEFHQFSDAIVKQTSIGEGPHFQPLALSNRSTMNEAKWNVEKAFDLGINKDGRVKTVSQHYYQTHEGQPLQGTLLNHNMTEGQTDVFKKPIDYLKKPTPPNGIEFVLGEVGSALAAGIPGRDYNLSASLGAALWNVDWMLYAMTIDVKRINMQLGRSFPFAAWQPIDNNGRKAQVLGQFYGHVFIADFIGKEGGLRVSQIDTDHKNIVAYAGYHGGKLSKVAIANLNLWAPNQTPNQTRPQRNVTLSGLPDSAKKVRVKRLTGPDATTHQDITWAGNRWTFESNGKPEKVNDNGDVVRDVGNNGSVTLNLASSQAILVHLE